MAKANLKFVAAVAALYMVALQTSIAGMEITSWLLVVATFFSLGPKTFVQDMTRRNQKPGLEGLCLAVMLAAVFLGLMISPIKGDFWLQFGFMRWAILLYGLSAAFAELIRSERLIERGMWLWQFVLVVIAGYAVFQFFTGIDIMGHGENPLRAVGPVWKATGTFTMSLTYAISVAMASAVALGWALKSTRYAWWNWFVVLMGGAGILVSMSRNLWLAFPALVLCAVFVYRRKIFWPLLGAFVVAVVAIGVAVPDLASKLDTLAHLGQDGSTMKRVALWRGYWAIFLDHPWFGAGLFQAKELLPEYFSRLGIQSDFFSHAHNNLLQWLAGGGIFAAAAYILFSIRMVWRAWEIRASALGLGLFLAQIIFHIGGLTDCTFFDGEVNHMIVFVWALVLAGTR